MQYNQLTALLAISKASLKGQLRSPMGLVFGFFFPFFFILIFGNDRSSAPAVRIAFSEKTDTTNGIYAIIKSIPAFVITDTTETVKQDFLTRGRITAIIDIQKKDSSYQINLQSSTASVDKIDFLNNMLKSIVSSLNDKAYPQNKTIATINKLPVKEGRIYRSIDFVLPGQLGFSLLSAGLFGIAFLFFNLRETLVLKRLSASPIKKLNIILGEIIARVFFQLIITTIIILVGHFYFKFTLVNGFVTYLELLALSFLGLMVFMGFGFLIAGTTKTINTIPALTNLLGFPQFMLAGTFFPITNLPNWLQIISKVLPLTHLNNAFRKIAFEGAHLTACGLEIGILALWAIVVYFFAIKSFKWE